MQNEKVYVNLPSGISSEYSMDVDLRKTLDRIRQSVTKRDKDFVMIVDGNEGSGKSTLAIQMGTYFDPTLNLDRICFSGAEFKQAILSASQGQCVIFDEAFTGLASRSALSEINKMLVSLMMQMRQKNLFVIIVLPTFFLLDKYVALFRAKCLVNVYELRGVRGYFRVFNRKKKKYIYLSGMKYYDYGKVNSRLRGRFYGKFPLGDEIEKLYRDKKMKCLEEKEEQVEEDKYLLQRDLMICLIRKSLNLSESKTADLLAKYNIPIKVAQVGHISRKHPEIMAEVPNP